MPDDLHVVDIKADKMSGDWYAVTAKLSDGRTVGLEAAITADLAKDWPAVRIILAELVMRKVRGMDNQNA